MRIVTQVCTKAEPICPVTKPDSGTVISKVSGSAQAVNDKPRFLDVSLAEATKVLGSNTLTAKTLDQHCT
jgi:hypothetical protein